MNIESNKEKLRQLQLTELEILCVIDEFCKKYNIKYSLYAGTLLGAVRHKGFIPWDDDLDICMSRENYRHFLSLWSDHPVEGYLLQNKDIEPDFTQSFSKIRKDNTAFLQKGEEHLHYHKGIFVDVFPIDRMPPDKLRQTKYQLDCMFYQLLTREFIPQNSSLFVRSVTTSILKLIGKEKRNKIRKELLKRITQYDTRQTYPTVGTEIYSTIRMPLPADLMDEYVDLEFEGRKYMCMKKWDEYLHLEYGNYWQLPPEEEREWKHFPLAIDFEHNLEGY